jgi:hypothetical protein
LDAADKAQDGVCRARTGRVNDKMIPRETFKEVIRRGVETEKHKRGQLFRTVMNKIELSGKIPTIGETNPEVLTLVFVNSTGNKYHAAGCRYVKSESEPLGIREAKAKRYEPCKICKPEKTDGRNGGRKI